MEKEEANSEMNEEQLCGIFMFIFSSFQSSKQPAQLERGSAVAKMEVMMLLINEELKK